MYTGSGAYMLLIPGSPLTVTERVYTSLWLSVDVIGCRYALGDLFEMSGYGLTQRSASNVRISGLCTDPYKVCCNQPLMAFVRL